MTTITIKTIPPVDDRLHNRLFEAARRAADTVRRWFDFTVEQLEIEVYTSRSQWIEEHTRLNEEELASWVSGDSGRIIRVVATGSEEHLLNMVSHECVHHIIHKQAANLPAWLDEGIAMHLLLELPKTYRHELKQAIRHDALIPFELLASPFTLLDRRLKDLAYGQSWVMVMYMTKEYGPEKIRELLLRLGRGDSMDQALRPLRVNMYLLEKAMIRYFMNTM
jgi:hypothetical protein